MRFAVVEYSSKSGTVWRHTAERPNYLADPVREIDPTSFGCYVSALRGEHVPLLGLITGPVAAVNPALRFYRKAVKRLTGSWPRYALEYLTQFDVILMVHQISDAHELVTTLHRLRQLPRRPVIIGVPTQPYGQLREVIEHNPTAADSLREFIRACDVFISLVQETTSWYENLSGRSVPYVPQPYPASYARQFFKARSEKEPTILVAGVTQRNNIRQGQRVAVALQREFPDYTIVLPKVSDLEYDYRDLGSARYRVLPFEKWHDHLQTLARTALVINTDYTLTRGRVQTDCAAVGTPSLGGNSDGTRDLFPELRSDPDTSTKKIVALGRQLLTDDVLYKKTADRARQNLLKYDYEESAARLRELIGQFQHPKG